MSDDLFIPDGYTLSKKIDAVPGLHPAVSVVYRPALNAARRAHQRAAVTGADDYAKADIDLILKHVVTLNGQSIATLKDKLAKMRPAVLGQLLDLILGYTPADEEADLKN